MIKYNILTLALITAFQANSANLVSIPFNDVIKSNGSGVIDLFSPQSSAVTITPDMLEALRQDNNGELVFGVNVNEAASGTEKAESQAVAIESLQLVMISGGQEVIYNTYSTQSSTLLFKEKSSNAEEYFTLIGDKSDWDATINIPVDIDLTLVEKATLNITFLKTDGKRGDPEAFYDFSNGFEDISILTAEDAYALNNSANGMSQAPMVIAHNQPVGNSWQYYPASDSFYIASFEDLYPQKGDYDFNDLVIAYRVSVETNTNGQVVSVAGNGYLIARGASYDHDFYLGFDFPGEVSGEYQVTFNDNNYEQLTDKQRSSSPFNGALSMPLVTNIANVFFDGISTYVNTFAKQTVVKGPRFDFSISFDQPTNWNFGETAPFDPFIYVHETGYEIHSVGKSARLGFSKNNKDQTFRDEANLPFALILNDQWLPPLAGVDMGLAYPTFIEHVQSRGQKNTRWFESRDNNKIKNIPFTQWQW